MKLTHCSQWADPGTIQLYG